MSREHLYKAKRVNWEELPKAEWWVYGYYAEIGGKSTIIERKCDTVCFVNGKAGKGNEVVEVLPETVCEYTGLKDEGGKKVFENDIVRFKHGGEFHDKGIWYRNYAIEYINTFCTYGLRFRNKSIHFPCKQATVSMHDVEVIGNIFDNFKLLESCETEEKKQE